MSLPNFLVLDRLFCVYVAMGYSSMVITASA